MPDDIDPQVLARFLAGEANDAEAEDVHRWAAADPAHARELELLRGGLVPRERHFSRPWRVGAMWGAVEDAMRLDAARNRGARLRQGMQPAAPRRSFWLAGSAIAIAAGMCLVWFEGHRIPKSLQFQQYATKSGQREAVTLSDGTQFVLAPTSVLRVPVAYAKGDRTVQLDGEAYFTVVHDERHPFSVHAANAVVTDIGTQFDVRAYAGDAATRVAVVEGRVGLEPMRAASPPPLNGPAGLDRSPGTTLTAGDIASVFDTAVAVTRGANVTALTAWRRGELAFDNEPVRDVARAIGRWYGVEVRIPDTALATRRVTAAFVADGAGDSLGAVLSELAFAVHARAQRTATGATLVPDSLRPNEGVK